MISVYESGHLQPTRVRAQVGGAKVMHDQLVHLAEMSERPNVTVEVIPDTSGAHSGQIAEERSVVTAVALAFDTLRSEALPWRASRDLIRKAAEERWT